MNELQGVAVGTGYFSQFHLDAWSRINNVRMRAICDIDPLAAKSAAQRHGISRIYTDFVRMLDAERPDFIDIITRPDTHLWLVEEAVRRRIPIICQKPLAPTFAESQHIVQIARSAGVPLMVHENFRFQPWYREVRRQLNQGAIGDRLHSISFRCRTGDGWQKDAYLQRQPYFREMPRFLIFETGVHFVEVFRYLAGEIESVYASLQTLNPDIVGEDAATVLFEFRSGATGIWDGNRYNETNSPDPRLTFGEAVLEGNHGTIRLDGTGRLTLQPLGQRESEIEYSFEKRGFAGDSVFATQQHFVKHLNEGGNFETSGEEYLKTLAVVEAIYQSATSRLPVRNELEAPPCV